MSIPKSVREIATTLVVLLLIVSSLIIFSTFLPTKDDTAYSSELLQYEWPQFQGDSSFTRFSAGPAPETPDILWKTNITGIRSYISAFNGKVFVMGNTTVFAIDRETGSLIWNTTVPAPGPWPAVHKIDDTHMVVGNSCLHPDTGRILWTSAHFSAAPQPLFSYNVYSPEEKMFYLKDSSYVQAWDFSDPSIPPTLAWETFVSGSGSVGSGVQYGDGKVFSGSYEPHQMALDAKTGAVLWDTETTGPMLFSGTFSNGKFFRGGTHDNTFYAFDATNGTVLWTFNPGTSDGYWCVGSAAAYGMVYELNKDGNLYALDENTGDVVWQYKGPGPLLFPGTPTVSDGKIYATTGQAAQYFGLQSESEFACLDAYTGQLIWKLPIEAFAPRESVAIAYGNLYLIPGDVTTAVDSISGDEYLTRGQVWAMGPASWPMWRQDPAHSAIGQSGPVNLTLRWKFTTGGAVISSPSAAYGMIYFGSQDKKVYCVDARRGEFVWNFNTDARIKSSPAVVDRKVYLGPDDGNVYCLDAYSGSLIWMKPAGGYIPANFEASVMLSSSPAVVGDRVYVGSLDTNLYCLNAKNGDLDWKYKTEGYITSSPAVADGAVYLVSQEPESGTLYKVDADTGLLIWKTTLPYNFMYQEGTDMHASPTVADGMVFASSNIKEYYGINTTTGNIEWTYRDDTAVEFIICSTIYKDGKLFLIDKFSIVCVDAKNGHPIWESFIGDELYVSPSYADGKLYVVTDQRHIYVLNATNGEKLGVFETSSNSWSAATIYEGRVYVGNNNWNVYCLAEYPALNSSITVELVKPQIVSGEVMTGSGHLVPGITNAPIILAFFKPDGTMDDVQVATFEKGEFNFTYIPDVAGNWAVAARWQSDKGYWNSANSEYMAVEVVAPTPVSIEFPVEYVYVAVAVVVIVVVLLAVLLLLRRKK